jgi:hypothetical protein
MVRETAEAIVLEEDGRGSRRGAMVAETMMMATTAL